jgi:hypothetical protein
MARTTALPFISLLFISLLFISLPFISLPFISLPFILLPFISLQLLPLPFLSLPFISLLFISLPFLSLPFHPLPFLSADAALRRTQAGGSALARPAIGSQGIDSTKLHCGQKLFGYIFVLNFWTNFQPKYIS